MNSATLAPQVKGVGSVQAPSSERAEAYADFVFARAALAAAKQTLETAEIRFQNAVEKLAVIK